MCSLEGCCKLLIRMNKLKCLLDQLFDSSVLANNIIEAGSPLRTPLPGGYKPTHRISLCHHHSSTLLISLNVHPVVRVVALADWSSFPGCWIRVGQPQLGNRASTITIAR